MLTRWVSQSPYSYRSVGKARNAGLSSDSKRLRRDPSRLRKGRSLRRTSSSRMAWLTSAKLKNFLLRFVTGLHRAGRHYGHTVMRGHLLIRPIDRRLIAASFGHTGLQIIGDDDLGHTAQKLEGAHVGADPVGQP